MRRLSMATVATYVRYGVALLVLVRYGGSAGPTVSPTLEYGFRTLDNSTYRN